MDSHTASDPANCTVVFHLDRIPASSSLEGFVGHESLHDGRTNRSWPSPFGVDTRPSAPLLQSWQPWTSGVQHSRLETAISTFTAAGVLGQPLFDYNAIFERVVKGNHLPFRAKTPLEINVLAHVIAMDREPVPNMLSQGGEVFGREPTTGRDNITLVLVYLPPSDP